MSTSISQLQLCNTFLLAVGFHMHSVLYLLKVNSCTINSFFAFRLRAILTAPNTFFNLLFVSKMHIMLLQYRRQNNPYLQYQTNFSLKQTKRITEKSSKFHNALKFKSSSPYA